MNSSRSRGRCASNGGDAGRVRRGVAPRARALRARRRAATRPGCGARTPIPNQIPARSPRSTRARLRRLDMPRRLQHATTRGARSRASSAPTTPPISRQIAPGKPMIVGETGLDGGARQQGGWIAGMFASLSSMPAIRGLIWFDRLAGGRLAAGVLAASSLAAFSRGVRAARFAGAGQLRRPRRRVPDPGRAERTDDTEAAYARSPGDAPHGAPHRRRGDARARGGKAPAPISA